VMDVAAGKSPQVGGGWGIMYSLTADTNFPDHRLILQITD
jgi:hypothetical protein